jgi:histidyl-tRNA synthetase
LLEFFDEIGIPYILNPRLVGTFNYYSRTVFRIFHDSQEEGEAEKEKSLPLGSGGRFDSLIQSMGGKPTPAAAGIMGIERILHALRKIPDVKFETPQSRVFLVQLGDLSKRKSFSVLEKLRRAGISVQESLGKDSIKSQLKIAEKVGAEIALIIGQKEAIDGTIIVREVSSGSQETTPQEKLIDLLERKLKK